jgi:hypothetical protein
MSSRRNAVGPEQVRLMCDDIRTAALRGRAQKAHRLAVYNRVTRRLVGEKQPALDAIAPRDRDALALTRTVRVAICAPPTSSAHRQSRRSRGFGATPSSVLNRRRPDQVEVLEDVADRPATHPGLIRARRTRVDAVTSTSAAGWLLDGRRS